MGRLPVQVFASIAAVALLWTLSADTMRSASAALPKVSARAAAEPEPFHWATDEELAAFQKCEDQAAEACGWVHTREQRTACRLHNREECEKAPAAFPARLADLKRMERGHTYPRVKNDVVNVRDWPDEEAEVVGKVRRGETVIAVRPGDFSEAWTEVITNDGAQGWIRNDNLDTSGGE